MTKTYEQLKAEVQKLLKQRRIAKYPTTAQRVDWAYGTTKIENRKITRKHSGLMMLAGIIRV